MSYKSLERPGRTGGAGRGKMLCSYIGGEEEEERRYGEDLEARRGRDGEEARRGRGSRKRRKGDGNKRGFT